MPSQEVIDYLKLVFTEDYEAPPGYESSVEATKAWVMGL